MITSPDYGRDIVLNATPHPDAKGGGEGEASINLQQASVGVRARVMRLHCSAATAPHTVSYSAGAPSLASVRMAHHRIDGWLRARLYSNRPLAARCLPPGISLQ